MIKRLVVAILLLALAVAAGTVAGCGGGLPTDAVAKVGGTLIMKADFDKRVQEFAAQYQVPSKDTDPTGWAQFESDVLEYMVDYQMAVQQAAKDGITVTDDELQKQIDSIVTQYYGGDNAKFTADLTSNNMTLDQLKNNYRESMLMQKVYDKVTASVTTVSDADIAAYYEKNKSTYFTDETRVVRHILIKPGTSATNTTTTAPWGSSTTESTTTTEAPTTTTVAPTDADWAAALATAQEVRQKLVDGGDWKTLAAEYSDDTSTANKGGDLGTVQKGQMVKEFEDATFALKLNEISQPVKSTYGYHVIQVTAITPAVQHTLDEVKSDIQSTLLNDAKSAAWNKWLSDTKKTVGVTYQKGMEPTTTTTGGSATTSVGTPTTAAGETTTTATGDTTTTAAGETITTSGEATTATTSATETTTTAKP